MFFRHALANFSFSSNSFIAAIQKLLVASTNEALFNAKIFAKEFASYIGSHTTVPL